MFRAYDLGQRLRHNSYIGRGEMEARLAPKFAAHRRLPFGRLQDRSARRAGTSILDRNWFGALERARKNGGRGAKERKRAPNPRQCAIIEAERKRRSAKRRPEGVANVEGGLVEGRGEIRTVDRFPH